MNQRPEFPLQVCISVALIGEFKRARSACGGVDARINIRSANMKATSKASSIPLISIVGACER